jgi:hypothetical protein
MEKPGEVLAWVDTILTEHLHALKPVLFETLSMESLSEPVRLIRR